MLNEASQMPGSKRFITHDFKISITLATPTLLQQKLIHVTILKQYGKTEKKISFDVETIFLSEINVCFFERDCERGHETAAANFFLCSDEQNKSPKQTNMRSSDSKLINWRRERKKSN